eukprot:5080977-Amphidinium_carterae.1
MFTQLGQLFGIEGEQAKPRSLMFPRRKPKFDSDAGTARTIFSLKHETSNRTHNQPTSSYAVVARMLA